MSGELSFVASKPLGCWVCGILIVKSGFVSPYSTKPALLQDIKAHVLANNIARFRLTPCLPSDLNYELKVEVLRRKGSESEVAPVPTSDRLEIFDSIFVDGSASVEKGQLNCFFEKEVAGRKKFSQLAR